MALTADVKRLSDVLNARQTELELLEDYRNGRFPPPPWVQDSSITRAYRMLMDLAGSNWPALIVSAVEERLEVQGIRYGDSEEADEEAWDIWQRNGLDAASSMLHDTVLTTGRGFAVVWGDGRSPDPEPVVTYEHPAMCVVEYEPGHSRQRRAALRRWRDGAYWYANLYLPGKLHKFRFEGDELPSEAQHWSQVEELDGIPDEVPVVEFGVNRTLYPSPYGTGCGEFATHLRHIDRINYKVFSGLVALTWSGFPLRYVIGDPILYEKQGDGADDKTKPIPPFDAVASAVAQFTNPDTKVGQLPEASIDNYSPEMDIKHLAAMTKTPAYYLLGELVNISADGIRAGEGGLISKVHRHHRMLGEDHEEVTRLAFKVRKPDDPRAGDESAEIMWRDPESRSMAERADAATKLKDTISERGIMEFVLGLTPKQIGRYEADAAAAVLDQVVAQLPAPPTPAAAQNGGTPPVTNADPAR